jgi:Ser/Thr protein kinase RdoA (MazF antagonist)
VELLPQLKHVFSAWDIDRIVSCRYIRRGEVNRNYIMNSPKAKYILRQVSHSHHKTSDDLEFELAYLDYLKHSRFPYEIPSVIPTKNGERFVEVQGQYWWLYKFIEGVVTQRLGETRLAQLAQMTAIYHLLIEQSNLNNGKPTSDLYNRTAVLKEIEDFRKEILGGKQPSRYEVTFLDESERLIPILRELDESRFSNVGRYPIHRDLIPENLIWKRGKLAGVIDFENVSGSNDPIVKDIAVTMQYCCRDNEVRFRLNIDLAKRFLRSYQKHRPLPEEEVRLIPDLITAGFIEDFAYAFWMLKNDPKRGNRSRLTLYSKAAQWSHSNKEGIVRAFLNRVDVEL